MRDFDPTTMRGQPYQVTLGHARRIEDSTFPTEDMRDKPFSTYAGADMWSATSHGA